MKYAVRDSDPGHRDSTRENAACSQERALESGTRSPRMTQVYVKCHEKQIRCSSRLAGHSVKPSACHTEPCTAAGRVSSRERGIVPSQVQYGFNILKPRPGAIDTVSCFGYLARTDRHHARSTVPPVSGYCFSSLHAAAFCDRRPIRSGLHLG